MIKIGTYTGVGVGIEYGVSQEKKTEFVKVTLQIKGGEFDSQLCSRDLYFSEKALARTLEALRALGCTFPGNDITNTEGFGGTTVTFTVEHETYTNADGHEKTFAKIGFINSGHGIKPELVMDAAKKAAFKARMAGTIASSKPVGATNSAPATGKAPF
jgi:hypothetical protein